MSYLESLAAQASVPAQEQKVENNTDKDAIETINNDVVDETIETEVPVVEDEKPIEQEITAPEVKPNEPAPVTKPHFANEELERYNAFVMKTGKSWDDFQALNRPTSEIDPKDLLKQYYSEKEGMTDKEILYELSELLGDEEDEDFDFDDPKDKLKREANLARELRKASEWRNSYVTDLNTSLETPNNAQEQEEILTVEKYQEEVLEAQKKSLQDYRETIYSKLPDVKSVELEVNGEKFQMTPDEDYSKNLKAVAEDFGIATNEYFDESGKLTNPDGWLDFVSWAHKPTRDAKINKIVEQAVLRDREANSKQRRNVTPETIQGSSDSTSNDSKDYEEWRASRKNNPFG